MTIQNLKMLILQSNKTEMKKILTWNQRIFEVALQITSCCQSTKQLFKYLFSTSKDIILVITVCMNWNKVVLPWQKWLFAKTWSYKYLSSYSYTALNGPNSLSLTWDFFSLRSRTFCSSFLCFLVRGFLVDTGVREAFFFLALLAGRTKALLSSTPFSLPPSEENRSPETVERQNQTNKWQYAR